MRTRLSGALIVGTLAIGFLGQVSSAEAATFTFDFRQTSSNFPGSSSLDFVNDGITITATGFDENGSSGNVIRNDNGLGIYLGGLDSPQIDSNGRDETLRLLFNQSVKLVSANFARVGFNVDSILPPRISVDEFKLSTDGVTVIPSANLPNPNLSDFGTGSYSFAALISTAKTGTIFDFSVPGGSNDDYFLSGLTVETVPIPTPALLPGLIGMGVAAMRKKKREEELETVTQEAEA